MCIKNVYSLCPRMLGMFCKYGHTCGVLDFLDLEHNILDHLTLRALPYDKRKQKRKTVLSLCKTVLKSENRFEKRKTVFALHNRFEKRQNRFSLFKTGLHSDKTVLSLTLTNETYF